jgi:hypothetical protein
MEAKNLLELVEVSGNDLIAAMMIGNWLLTTIG